MEKDQGFCHVSDLYRAGAGIPAPAGWRTDLRRVDLTRAVSPKLEKKDAFPSPMMQCKRKSNATRRKSSQLHAGCSLCVGNVVAMLVSLCLARPAASLVSPSKEKSAACRTNTSLLTRIIVMAAALLQVLLHVYGVG